MRPSRASSEKYEGWLFCPFHLDFNDFVKQRRVKADFLWDFFFIISLDANDHQIPRNSISRNTNRTGSEPANARVLGKQHFWRPGRRIKCWVVYFKIPAETVPSSKSCCASKPSVQTSGSLLALIPFHVRGSIWWDTSHRMQPATQEELMHSLQKKKNQTS